MKKLTVSVATLLIAGMSYGQSTQCNGVTKDSVQCKNTTKTEVKLCYLHNPNYVKAVTTSAPVSSGYTLFTILVISSCFINLNLVLHLFLCPF